MSRLVVYAPCGHRDYWRGRAGPRRAPAPNHRVEYRRLDPPVQFDICTAHLKDRPPSHLAQKFIAEMRNELSRRPCAAE